MLKCIVKNNTLYTVIKFFNFSDTSDPDTSYSVAEYQSLTGLGAGNVMADPMFKNVAGNDFRGNTGSPAN